MTVDFDDWGYFGGLDHESKVHIVATIILHEEGGPLAEELLSMRPLDGRRPQAAPRLPEEDAGVARGGADARLPG